ncbi:glycoside hydrolase family 3 N-terminal domain-containing protein [Paracoccus sp. SCSIO 75233]|uniref:glycoside hydrolase family 3 N-terminal domain-containing protein n=1 Tax=Paracoccus sp. SCSIO 75233 TaxID=3017782 RepID=UPI0022F0B6CC|nr:glycoside hydrolase family 3 N-terminal domain-containing protein [Paracoccus sp. SCSIO 75233]WBU54622.1 beta-hexosaminidase [Paracoccus sp. SCSIO 75233]
MTTAAIFGLLGTKLTKAERDFFRSADPWGFILFARNIETPDQIRRLTGDLRDAVGRDAVITIDQEGGRVQRMRAPHWAEWTPPLEDAENGSAALRLRYRLIGQELRAVGIDSNCAPTLDIASNETHPFLQNRCLGRNVADVVSHGRAVAEGLLQAGVLPVMKHMPGHGRARVDSHFETPAVAAPLAELADTDFAPFRALNDLPLGMSAHIRFTELDDAPATASARMIGIIRDEIGFDGLLMTDDISMNGLSGSIGERSAAAIAAGCDLILHCHGDMGEMEEVVANAGAMTSVAQRRGDDALRQRAAPDDVAAAELLAEYRASGGRVDWPQA